MKQSPLTSMIVFHLASVGFWIRSCSCLWGFLKLRDVYTTVDQYLINQTKCRWITRTIHIKNWTCRYNSSLSSTFKCYKAMFLTSQYVDQCPLKIFASPIAGGIDILSVHNAFWLENTGIKECPTNTQPDCSIFTATDKNHLSYS